MQTHTFTVTKTFIKKRLDLFVSQLFPNFTRSYIVRLIKTNCIQVNDSLKKASYLVREGDHISIEIPERQEQLNANPEPIPLKIVYEDDDIIVINKSAGMVVHPAPGHSNGTLVNALLHYNDQQFSKIDRFGIVHRLDQDTTGCIVVAKNAQAQLFLNESFKDRKIKKHYMCIVYGQMDTDKGKINLPIGRHPIHRKKMSTISKNGRSAETHWHLSCQFNQFALLNILLKTGRTHQIRVHLAAMNHPIVGDQLYGNQRNWRNVNSSIQPYVKKIKRQMLHAFRLGFTHPSTKKYIQFEASLPVDMEEFLTTLRE